MTPDPLDTKFWKTLDQFVATNEIIIDRPKNSRHPKFPSLVYPMDYGYLKETSAMDGGGIDIWIGSQPEPQVVGILATVDLLKQDAEIKILYGCTENEIQLALNTANTESQSAKLIRRNSN